MKTLTQQKYQKKNGVKRGLEHCDCGCGFDRVFGHSRDSNEVKFGDISDNLLTRLFINFLTHLLIYCPTY